LNGSEFCLEATCQQGPDGKFLVGYYADPHRYQTALKITRIPDVVLNDPANTEIWPACPVRFQAPLALRVKLAGLIERECFGQRNSALKVRDVAVLSLHIQTDPEDQ
jgi:hypothetical protein